MYNMHLVITGLVFLTSCGPAVNNTDKPGGVYVGESQEVSGGESVKIAKSAPTSKGQEISGISCKNKLWNPEPTNDVAIAVLKREAEKAGYNTVYILEIKPNSGAILINCWSAIIAKGIAFNT